MVSKKNINLVRKDLDDDQKRTINKSTLGLKILGFFLPVVYILWARAYKILGLYFLLILICGGIASHESGEGIISTTIYTIIILLFRILVFTNGSKRAFNNSQGRLKNLV